MTENIEQKDALEPEEGPLSGEALAENNALALVFDDVRSQSADSELVVATRWPALGLVPSHMTDEDLEMLVFEYLDTYKKQHAEDVAARSSESVVAFAQRQGAASTGSTRAIAGPSPFASRSVGVPRMFAAKAEPAAEAPDAVALDGVAAAGESVLGGARAAGESALGGVRAAGAPAAVAEGSQRERDGASSGLAAPAASAPAAPADAMAPAEPDDDNPFAGLKIPQGYELVQIEGEWVLVETDEEPEPVALEVNPKNIEVLMGAHCYYLYASDVMTDAYAHWAFLAAEDDPLVTFADCVREESRIYPRPMPTETLMNAPFRMSREQIEQAWEASRAHEDYADIRRIEASNGDVYFFSDAHLSQARAQALAEWDAVERYMNV